MAHSDLPSGSGDHPASINWEAEVQRYNTGEISEAEWEEKLEQAFSTASSNDLLLYILPYCPDHILDSALTALTKRRLWQTVGEILLQWRRGLSEQVILRAVQEAGQYAEDVDMHYIILRLKNMHFQFQLALTEVVVNRRDWNCVVNILAQCHNHIQLDFVFDKAYEHAEEIVSNVNSDYKDWSESLTSVLVLSPYNRMFRVLDLLLKHPKNTKENKKYITVAADTVLQNILNETLSLWAAAERVKDDDEPFWTLYHACREDDGLCQYLAQTLCDESKLVQRAGMLDRILIRSVAFFLSRQWSPNVNKPREIEQRKQEVGEKCQEELPLLPESVPLYLEEYQLYQIVEEEVLQLLQVVIREATDAIQIRLSPVAQLVSIQRFIKEYINLKQFLVSDEPFIKMLTTAPVIPFVQTAILNFEKNPDWKLLQLANLAHVWEDVRRDLFRKAVKDGQWDLILLWAHHSLYDNERGFAIQEAYAEKNWQALLVLAEHGLSQDEEMRVQCLLARDADWHVVLEMIDRGAVIKEIRDHLEANSKNIVIKDHCLYKEDFIDRQEKLTRLEDEIRLASKKPLNILIETKAPWRIFWKCLKYKKNVKREIANAKALPRLSTKQARWMTYYWERLKNKLKTERFCLHAVLEAAKERDEFAMVHLARTVLKKRQRDSFFAETLEKRWWRTCRVLIERGITTKTALAALPFLLQQGQWILVARVLEYDVGDDVRCQIIKQAVDCKQGSLVSHAVRTMEHRLPLDEREALFRMAMNSCLWEAARHLVEEPDTLGVNHRDAALRIAIKYKQWDLVDHCIRFDANINLLDENGNSYLKNAVDENEWETALALLERGAQQCLSTCKDTICSELFLAIFSKKWDVVERLIQYHGDVNRPDGLQSTSWKAILHHGQIETIKEILYWGCSVTDLGEEGESALHVACKAEEPDWETMHCLVHRGVDPSAVTTSGRSALMNAVEHKKNAQRLLAECIKMGFSTCQPAITDHWFHKRKDSFKPGETEKRHLYPLNTITDNIWNRFKNTLHYTTAFSNPAYQDIYQVMRALDTHEKTIYISPLEYTLVSNQTVLREMLYESGACSHKELMRLYRELKTPDSLLRRKMSNDQIRELLPDMKRLAETPRTLKSFCRLVISRCLGFRRRIKAVRQLDLNDQSLKGYILFSELTDPNYASQ